MMAHLLLPEIEPEPNIAQLMVQGEVHEAMQVDEVMEDEAILNLCEEFYKKFSISEKRVARDNTAAAEFSAMLLSYSKIKTQERDPDLENNDVDTADDTSSQNREDDVDQTVYSNHTDSQFENETMMRLSTGQRRLYL
jgi:hypothetical protein